MILSQAAARFLDIRQVNSGRACIGRYRPSMHGNYDDLTWKRKGERPHRPGLRASLLHDNAGHVISGMVVGQEVCNSIQASGGRSHLSHQLHQNMSAGMRTRIVPNGSSESPIIQP